MNENPAPPSVAYDREPSPGDLVELAPAYIPPGFEELYTPTGVVVATGSAVSFMISQIKLAEALGREAEPAHHRVALVRHFLRQGWLARLFRRRPVLHAVAFPWSTSNLRILRSGCPCPRCTGESA